MTPGSAAVDRIGARTRLRDLRALVGEPPRTHAAPGWHTSRHALRLTQRFGFEYASDTRGIGPYMPVCDGELVLCPQLPTTLPTLDELIDHPDTAHERVLEATAAAGEADDVFALRAELPARRSSPPSSGCSKAGAPEAAKSSPSEACSKSLEPARLPRHVVAWNEIPGQSAALALQGAAFLA